MINPNELRIGNYVCVGDPSKIFVTCPEDELKKDVDIVNEISSYSIDIFNDGNYGSASYFAPIDPKNINPIPLTEEWLVKLGAKWEGDYVVLELNKITIKTTCLPNMKPERIFVYVDGIEIKELKYVHQLQNLYFALTGEELIPK